MKKLKLITTTLFSSLLTSTAVANDGAYTLSGNQLIPITTTSIDVVKENLVIKRIPIKTKEEKRTDIDVSVRYELVNKGKSQSVIVGFEANRPFGDINECAVNGKHPYMQDFSVRVNGKKRPYKVAIVPMKYYEQMQGKASKSLSYVVNGKIDTLTDKNSCDESMFVYYFDANFKQGKNTIEHNYRFESSSYVTSGYQFDYVLSAINRWGNGKVEDFSMTIDMGDMSSFNVQNTFFDTAKEWQLQGKIKAYPTPKMTNYNTDKPSSTFAVYDGTIKFNKKNFTPKGELFIDTPNAPVFHNEVFDASVDDLPFYYPWIDEEKQLTPFSKQVLRNFPFARRGYVFKNKQLQRYYAKQPWYMADKTYKADYSKLSSSEKEHVRRYGANGK